MFGDSPWDYMSEEERARRNKEADSREKKRKAESKKRQLRTLQHFTRAELLAELYRRDKKIEFVRPVKMRGEYI